MTNEQLKRAQEIKKELDNLNTHREQLVSRLNKSRDQIKYKDSNYGYSELRYGFTHDSGYSMSLKKEFAPITDTVYANMYLSKLDAYILQLQSEFDSL